MTSAVNHGQPWCDRQDAWLWKAIHTKSVDLIADKMQRTSGSIRSRLMRLAASQLQAQTLTMEEACAHIRVSPSKMEEYIEKQKEKPAQKLDKRAVAATTTELQSEVRTEDTPSSALNEQQQEALRAVLEEKQSIFLTGPAGTGKTETIKSLVRQASVRGLLCGVTAMTGTAAFHIQGKTLHSFLGIGLGKSSASSLAARTQANTKRCELLKALQLLILDEVSMLDDELFDKISLYLQLVRKDARPFGGVQLVLCGDMCQLQSVNGTYCFLATEWKRLAPRTIHLHQVFRQTNTEFLHMLAELRLGICSAHTLERLRACQHTEFPVDVVPTRMYALNKDVDHVNQTEMERLVANMSPDKVQTYLTTYKGTRRPGGEWTASAVKRWAEAGGIPEKITLCPGARVLVTRNLPELHLFNGTQGKVKEVYADRVVIAVSGRSSPVVVPWVSLAMEDDASASVRCMPLRLAWAISIHKSQGMTLDFMEVDLDDRIFAFGQAYTALSRARDLAGVRIPRLSARAFRTHPDVLALYNEL